MSKNRKHYTTQYMNIILDKKNDCEIQKGSEEPIYMNEHMKIYKEIVPEKN